MKRLLMGLMIVSAILLVSHNSMALTVTPTSTASTLTGAILGGGITLVGTPTYVGGSSSSGTFTGGLASGIGIASGIIMTTGDATLAPGPNTLDGAGATTGTGSDGDLDSLLPPVYDIYDKTVLEFDFTTAGGNLYFNYVFASEEYNEYVSSAYNDVFGFFLDGTNIALIPSTITPVAIDNVNLGTNSAYYNNNDPSDITPPYNIQYDGFTDVFTAVALGLSAGTHHIKLAIGDAGDSILDSAVFIQGGSFSEEETPRDIAPEPSTFLLLGSALLGLGFYGRKRIKK